MLSLVFGIYGINRQTYRLVESKDSALKSYEAGIIPTMLHLGAAFAFFVLTLVAGACHF